MKLVEEKSTRDRKNIKIFCNEKALLAFDYVFLPANPFELCYRLRLIIQEKLGGNVSNKKDDQTLGIFDILLEYERIASAHHNNFLLSFRVR